MNVFGTCFAKKPSYIYLPEDDGEEEDHNVNKICCYFNFRGISRQGLIQLPPSNNNSQRTIVDYLESRSPVGIEALLQEQEEELDHYYGQTDDEDAYHGPQKRLGPLDPNFEHGNSSVLEEEDVQDLSEHCISELLVDRPKFSGAHIPNEDDNSMGQELLDGLGRTESSSSASISNRIFAFRKVEPEEETENNTSSQELAIITNRLGPYTTSLSSLSASSSTSTTSASLPSITHASVKQPTHEKGEYNTKYVSSVNAVGLSDFVDPIISSFQNNQHQKQEKHSEFPATTLTRVPYQPLPPLQISSCRDNFLKQQASSPTQQHLTGGKPPLVTTAHNILGNKLDDFTQKLVFIKNNIIMSIVNDDDEEEEEDPHYHSTNRKRAESAAESGRTSRLPYSSSTSLPPPRTSSMTNNSINRRLANTQDEREEEIFEFSKVASISKNVLTFGEGVVGNGFRMFNNLSTRIKNAQQQQQQQVELNTNSEALCERF